MGWFGRHKEEEDEEITRLVKHAAELHGASVREVISTVLDEDDEDEEEDEPVEPARKKSKHIGVWVTIILVGFAFGVVIILLMRFTSGSDMAGPKADAGVQAVQKNITAASPTPGTPSYSGKYISFAYPVGFDSVKAIAPRGVILDELTVNDASNYHRQIGVTVENLASASDDSGYTFRTMNPSTYTPTPIKVGLDQAVVMVKSDGTERTLYWAHAGKLVVIAVTNSTGGDNLTAFMQLITSTMRWIG